MIPIITNKCQSCGSSLIQMKLFDKWSFTVDTSTKTSIVYMFTFGVTMTLTGYVIYKIWKFNRALKESINEINKLNWRLDCIIIDLSDIHRLKIGQTEKFFLKCRTDKHLNGSDSNANGHKSRNNKNRSIDSQSVNETSSSNNFHGIKSSGNSNQSIISLSDAYETPNTSPETSSESDNDENESDNEFKDVINGSDDNNDAKLNDRKIISNLNKVPLKSALKRHKHDDNYLNLLSLPINDIKKLRDECECQYNQDENNVEKLINYMRALFVYAEKIEESHEFIKTLHYKCYELAVKAVELNGKISTTHKWIAITISKIINYMSINEKIKYSIKFKNHLDTAIQLNNTDYYLLYLRGRWTYKICNLSWAEKYGVRLIYGQIPNCTVENALNDFLKVEQLYPRKLKGNLLHVAKCYIDLSKHQEALIYLEEAARLSPITSKDAIEDQEINSLLQKYC